MYQARQYFLRDETCQVRARLTQPNPFEQSLANTELNINQFV